MQLIYFEGEFLADFFLLIDLVLELLNLLPQLLSLH